MATDISYKAIQSDYFTSNTHRDSYTQQNALKKVGGGYAEEYSLLDSFSYAFDYLGGGNAIGRGDVLQQFYA